MPFEYKPFVNRYVGAISDVMGQGAEARNRAALSVAETQAGAVGRLGDLTADRWRGLGQDVVGGVESYFTDKQEAKDREYTERLQAENLLQIAEGADARKRREESRALGATVARGRDVRSGPGGDQLALETGAGGEFQRTPLGSTRPPSRFRGGPPPGTRRDAEGNLVSAEPALLPAKTVRMNPTPYKAIDTRGLELHDIDKIAQEAMQAGLYEEFLPTLEALEGFNTRRGTRFDEAYADFQGTLKGSLGQPDALMSVAGDAFKHFSSELGGSPRFQALVNAHEAGDPAAFQEMFRRDSNTPIDAPFQLDPGSSSVDVWSGKKIPAEHGDSVDHFGRDVTLRMDDGRVIPLAQRGRRPDGSVVWIGPNNREITGSIRDEVQTTRPLTDAERRNVQDDLRQQLVAASAYPDIGAETLAGIKAAMERQGMNVALEIRRAGTVARDQVIDRARALQLLETVPRDAITGALLEDPVAAQSRRLEASRDIGAGNTPAGGPAAVPAGMEDLSNSAPYTEEQIRAAAQARGMTFDDMRDAIIERNGRIAP